MSTSTLLSNLFALTDNLAIPHNVVVIAIGLIVLCALYRWGGVVFLIYAVVHLWTGHWAEAILAIFYAAFIAFVRSFVSMLTSVSSSCTPRWRA